MSKLSPCFFIVAFLVYAGVLLGALNVDGLASLASDSVHYLLMARYLSPWGAPDAIAAQAFGSQGYPPLFGLLLGIAGAGHDFHTAHLLNGILLLAALLALWRYAAVVTGSAGIAFAATAIFAIGPGAWLNTLDVLSENLYLLLSLLVLLHARRSDGGPRALVLTGALLAALILTRTVGLAMLLAVAATGLIAGTGTRERLFAAGVPGAIALGVLLIVQFAIATGVPDQYVHGFDRIAEGESPHGGIEYGAFLSSQIAVLYDAWLGNWLWYWNTATLFNTTCVSVAGLLALSAVARGVRAGRIEAWYLAVYLAVILVWPHPGQMTRFVYPIAPLLLVLGLEEARRLGARLPSKWMPLIVPALLALLVVSVLPSLLYTWQRHAAGAASGLNRMTEFYRLPDLRAATAESAVHAQMAADLRRVGDLLPPEAAVLYYEPAYVALLADRRGIRPPSGAVAATLARDTGTPYLLLTRFDPRHWRAGDDRLSEIADPSGIGQVLYASASGVDGKPVSVLFSLPDAR